MRLADYIIVMIQNYSYTYIEAALVSTIAAKSLIRSKLETDEIRAAVVFRNDLLVLTATLLCG